VHKIRILLKGHLTIYKSSFSVSIKGTVSRDFLCCFVNQIASPGPIGGTYYIHWDDFDFFQKFKEIFKCEIISVVYLTPRSRLKGGHFYTNISSYLPYYMIKKVTLWSVF